MSKPEVEYDGKDYNIRPAYHLKKWKKKKHFVHQIQPIYMPDKTDLSVSSSIGSHNTGHSNTTFSHVTRSLNPHHRLYTVPITAEVILDQNTDQSKKVPDIDATRDRLFQEYIAIACKPNWSGLVDDHDTSNESIQFTSKVNPLPKELMGDLASSSSSRKKNPRNIEGGKSRALLNDLIDEIQAIEITTHDAQKGSHTIVDQFSFDMWKKAYFSETGLFGSIALFVETQYCELIDREKTENNKPTKLKAVVIADLLMKLVPALECHSKLIGPVIYELLNFVFCEYSYSAKSFSPNMNMQDFTFMHTYFDRFNDYHSQIAEGDEEIDYIKLGSQMNELVRKFQTVSLVFDIATRFLRDACFNQWKSLMVRDEHYRRICIRKVLRYRFLRMKAYRRTHINAEQEALEHQRIIQEVEQKKKQFQALFHQKKLKRRSIRNSIRNSMIQSQLLQHQQTAAAILRTVSRGGTDAEIRSILRSRSGNEPINTTTVDPTTTSYAHAIASAIAAASPLNFNVPPTNGNSRSSTPAALSPVRGGASTPHSPPRRMSNGGITMGPSTASISPINVSSILPTSPSDDLFDFRMLTINVIPPIQSESGSNPSSGNPTPLYARVGPSSSHSTPSLKRGINPEALSARRKPSPLNSASSGSGSGSGVTPSPKRPASQHQRMSSRNSIPESIPEMEAAAMALAESLVKKDGICQTPAEWIDHEPLTRVHKLKRHHRTDSSESGTFNTSSSQLSTLTKEAINITAARVSPFHKPDFKITPHGHAHVAVNRNSIETAQWNIHHQKYQLSFSISSQLISYVYSSMFPEQGCTHPAIDFSFHNSLLSYTKELLLYKYKVPSVADKFYKGLIGCCLSQTSQNRRIELFAKLCGVTSHTISAHSFDPVQFSSFINMLGILFKRDPWEIRNVMNSKKRDIFRKVVLSVLHKIVPTIHMRDPELFQHIVDDISALPVTNSNINMKVLDPQYDTIDIDDLLLMLMEYIEIERSENSEFQMEKMKESLAVKRKQQQQQQHHTPHTHHHHGKH